MICLVHLLALAQSGGARTPLALELDEPLRGRLADGRTGVEHTFVADRAMEVGLSLCSYDFDALLRVTRTASDPVEVAGGGIATDAWIRLALQEGERLRLEVLASDGRSGDYELLVSSRAEPPFEAASTSRMAADHCSEAARRARSRGEHERALDLFKRAGALLDQSGPLTRAKAAYQEVIASAKATAKDAETLRARTHIARIDLLLGMVRAATEELTHLREETRDPAASSIRLLVLTQLARAALLQGHFDLAIASCEEAQALAVVQESKVSECELSYLLGDVQTKQWKIPTAERLLLHAIELASQVVEPGLEAEAEFHYGLHFDARGKTREAYEHFLKALNLAPSAMVRVDILGSLGTVLFAMHRGSEARKCFEDSLTAAREIGLELYAAKYLHAFGNLEAAEGNLDLAIDLLERARNAWSDEAFRIDRAEVLLSLAQARRFRRAKGDEEALRLESQQVLEIGRTAGDLRLQVDAAILPYDANDLSQHDPGHRLLLEDLAKKAETSPDLESAAKIAGILAWDDFTRGRHEEATRFANLAYERFAVLGDEEQCLEALDTVAFAAVRRKNQDDLARAVERAELLLDREVRSAPVDEEDVSLRRFIARFEAFDHDLVALRLERPGLPASEAEHLKEAGFEAAGAWKARSLVESMIRRRQNRNVPEDEALRAARSVHAEARQQLEAVSHMHGSTALLDEAHLQTLQSRRKVEELEASAKARITVQYPDLLPRGKAPGAVRAVIPDQRTALIEYVAGTDRLYAYVLTRDRFDLITLGQRAPIEGEARAFVRLLAADALPEDSPVGTHAGIEGITRLGVSLYANLLAQPLAWLEPGVTRLVLVPTTELADLPFEALIERPPRAEDLPPSFADLAYLIRSHTVICAPSSPALVALAASRHGTRKPSILLFADPVYPEPLLPDGQPLRSGKADPLGEPVLERLENTRAEVSQIASLIAGGAEPARSEDAVAILEIQNGKRDHHISADGFELCLGPYATPKRFCRIAGDFTILHVAAHGLRSAPGSADPLLVLSSEDGGSGILTCGRILGLNLDADLVVLAACDTASGRRIDGDGLRSIARAFLHAGARAVVSSLWEVRDLETGALMKNFYAKMLRGGLPPEVALREVKLGLLEGRPSRGVPQNPHHGSARFVEAADPYFWAGIVYCGAPR